MVRQSVVVLKLHNGRNTSDMNQQSEESQYLIEDSIFN